MKSDFIVGIIGGNGKMGQSLLKFFKSKNIETIFSDKNSKTTNKEVTEKSDIIILSVPLTCYEYVLKEIKDNLSENKMLMDIGSLKYNQVNLMKKYFNGEILAAHPLFGHEKNFSGKENNIVIYKINDGEKTKFILKLFMENNLNIIYLEPEKHDEIMAYIHGFYYLINVSYLEILRNKFKNITNIEGFKTTSFDSYLKSLDNVFNTDDFLIKLIAYENPFIEEVKKNFSSVLNKEVDFKKIREFLY